MKVLVGVPTHKGQQYCLGEFADALKKQKIEFDILCVVNNGQSAYATLLKSKGLNAVENPLLVEGFKEIIISHRNYIRKYALENNYDYVLFLDSDIILPDENVISRLISVEPEIISGAYLNVFEINKEKVSVPFLLRDAEGGGQFYIYQAMFPPKIMEVGASGSACLLVKKKVLEKIDFDNSCSNEGIGFCLKAKKEGFKIWADTGIKCIHRAFPKDDKRARVFEWLTHIQDTSTEIDLGY